MNSITRLPKEQNLLEKALNFEFSMALNRYYRPEPGISGLDKRATLCALEFFSRSI